MMCFILGEQGEKNLIPYPPIVFWASVLLFVF